MSDRCPHCSALVKSDAQWCTLCYADLRAQPAPEAHVVQEARVSELALSGTGSGAPVAIDPLTAPLALVEQLTVAAPTGAIEATAGGEPAEVAAPAAPPQPTPQGWPCARCGCLVPFDLAACGTCGASFLAPGSRVSARHSVLDQLSNRAGDKRFRVAVMAVGGSALLAVIYGLMVLVGSLM